MAAGVVRTLSRVAGVTLLTIVYLMTAAASAKEPTASVVVIGKPGPAAAHGLEKICAALETKGASVERADSANSARGKVLVLAALASDAEPAPGLLREAGASLPEGREALVIRRGRVGGVPAVAVVGSDDRGLMYGLLEVADRIGWATGKDDLLAEVRDAAEKPFVSDRALSIYTMHRACFEQRFFNEKYWDRYFDMLARNRFNRFVLIFGYENWGYFAPPYPYFFDVKGFPGVRVVGITKEQQERNLRMLKRIIETAHARGLEFTVAIWDHIYRGGVQGPLERGEGPRPGIVGGLDQDNLYSYTKVALAKFLRLLPEMDSIQFRMHGESGLRRGEMEAFWTEVYRVMLEDGRGMRFDARAKNFPHELIDKAVEMGVPIRICTKYWMEQMSLPFHPTHIHPKNQRDRRHGYADLLRYPKRYDIHWRVWNAGTTRVLLWGDPDYVRRFAESTHLYDGKGFEINEPMGTKMQDHPHNLQPFELLRSKYRYYDWEFERYWHFYQVFGRVSYNPKTPPEVWQREFEQRFGSEAGTHVEQALHRASRILPRIVAYTYPYRHFPTTRGWAEMQRQEDLPRYAKALPSDTQQFLSIDAAAKCILEGKDSAKVWPRQSAAWFSKTAADVLASVERAEVAIGNRRSKEFASTMVDMKILAHLARYHSCRARSGVAWALFTHSHDAGFLDDAIAHEGRAVEAWREIVSSAGDVYHDDLVMGRRRAGLAGHWSDELTRLESGLESLQRRRKQFTPKVPSPRPAITHVPVRRMLPGKDVIVRATVGSRDTIREVRLRYAGGQGGDGLVTMKQTAPHVYTGVIPGAKVTPGLSYFIEALDGRGRRATFPGDGEDNPLAVTVTGDKEPPFVKHTPITGAAAAHPLRITAAVSDPAGVKWVRLRYRGVNQHFDYRTLPMHAPAGSDRYEATVPGEELSPRWDFMYFIEVMDENGNGKIWPDLEEQTPYVIVKLRR